MQRARPPRSRALLCLFVLLPLAGGAAKADAAVACGPLKRLVAMADSGFARLRGYFDPRLEAWVATYRMPGAYVCTIRDTEEIAQYLCTWKLEADAAAVAETYTRLQQQVTACLDVRETSRHEPAPQSQTTRFGLAGGRETVLVGKTESPNEGYSVTLEIVPLGFDELP